MDISTLTSFIQVDKGSDFPIQNLPYGVFRKKDEDDSSFRVGTALGNFVIDLSALFDEGMFSETDVSDVNPFNSPSLNKFMSFGKTIWAQVRNKLIELLVEDNPLLKDNAGLREKTFIPMENVILKLPVDIGDYTDFYSSKEHATNVGIMFRGKENALMPNWLHLPVAYNGRENRFTDQWGRVKQTMLRNLLSDRADFWISNSKWDFLWEQVTNWDTL